MPTGPILLVLDCAIRLVLRAAPERFRERHGDELRETVRDVCLDAHVRGGLVAMSAAGARELSDVVRASTRARLGRPARMQPPGRPWRPPRKDRSMPALLHDLRMAARALTTSPSYASLAVVTLALGIGMATAAFSVLDSVILRPLPFVASGRFVEILNERQPSGVTYPRFERRLFLEWRRQTDLFDRVEGYEGASAIWTSDRGSEMVPASFVTPGLFDMLGVPPLDGRHFGSGDGRAGFDRVLVVGERFWRERLGSRPDIVGESLTINGAAHRVIGVMPASFRFPYEAQQLWMPVDPDDPPVSRMQGSLSLSAFARLAAGATIEAAATEVKSRAPRLLASLGREEEGLIATIHDPNRAVDRTVRQSLSVLAAAVAFLLLIVCANVASLSLSHALSRARDFAVRASLGASRRDLVRETLAENALIGVAGVGLGLAWGWLLLQAARASLPPAIFFTSLNEVNLDPRALVFACLVGFVTVVLFGLPPAVMASRPAVSDLLRRDSRSASGSRASRRLRSAMVVVEVSVSIVLLAGAALMARSFVKLQSVDRGFDASHLAVLRVGLPVAGYQDPAAQDRFSEELMAALERIPRVLAATAGSVPPDSDLVSFGTLEFEHAPGVTADGVIVPAYRVWPDYFTTTGIALLEGRPFRDLEPREATIVSSSFAHEYWPDRSAIGGRFRFTGSTTWQTIVGVAAEVRQMGMDDSTGSFEFYYPMRTSSGTTAPALRASTDAIAAFRTFVIRARDPAAVLMEARRAVTALDGRVVIWDGRTVEQNFEAAVARPRVLVFMLALFGALGLLFAAAGLYAVLSFLVGQRLREIGIRVALGAAPREIFALVLGSGLGLTLAGLVAGAVLALGLARFMRAVLYDVEPTDPLSMTAVAVLIGLTALAASWRPATRAMRVDPMVLLRHE